MVSLSKCDKCSAIWPSAPHGVIHKCTCSGGMCYPIKKEQPYGWTYEGPDGEWHWSRHFDEHESCSQHRPATAAEASFFENKPTRTGISLEVVTYDSGCDVSYEVRVKGEPGSPTVGRGKTLKRAFGDFLINRQETLGIIEISLDEKAVKAEHKRRKKMLAKR